MASKQAKAYRHQAALDRLTAAVSLIGEHYAVPDIHLPTRTYRKDPEMGHIERLEYLAAWIAGLAEQIAVPLAKEGAAPAVAEPEPVIPEREPLAVSVDEAPPPLVSEQTMKRARRVKPS